MKLKEHREHYGVIRCLTGLKIGGSKDTLGFGETDNPVIRNPVTRVPYLPGSSLKGKTRSLLEIKMGKFGHDNERPEAGLPCDCARDDCIICRLFGCGKPDKGKEPTRIIFRDAFLTEEWEQKLSEALPGSFVEVKPEIAMDRKTGRTSPRSFHEQERLPEGTEFDFSFTLRVYEGDNLKSTYTALADAFEMLEKDYLGASGSRGYGQVEVFYYRDDDDTEGLPMHVHLRKLAEEAK